MTKPKRKVRVFRDFEIEEISLVDNPAQEGARIVLMKRDFSAEQREALAEQGKALPDGSYPIETVEDLKNAIQAFGRAPEDKRDEVAAHIRRRAKELGAEDQLPSEGALALDKTADCVSGEGHGQEEKEPMTKQNDPTPDNSAVEKRLAELENQLKLAKAEGTSQAEQLQKQLNAAKAESEALAKQLRDEKEARFDVELTKRAEDLKNLAGEVAVKKAVIRALDGIADEATRKAAFELLNSANTGLAKAFERVGVNGESMKDSSYEALIKRHMESHKVDRYAAATAVLKTTEGAKAYAEMRAQGVN